MVHNHPSGDPTPSGADMRMTRELVDIAKPLGIARLERLPGGWGVMADDLLAGLYANLIMQAVVRTNLWTWL